MKRFNSGVAHDYFNVIDTEHKAYFLGLIYADGSIIVSKNTNSCYRQKQLCLVLQEDDKPTLDVLCSLVKPLKKVNLTYPPSVEKRGWKKRASLKVSSDTICDRLIELGCPPNKTKIGLVYPDIPEELNRHFIRGFFDGNGYIYVKEVKNRYKRVKEYTISNPFKAKLQKRAGLVSTSKEFLETCLSMIDKDLNLKGKVQWRAVKKTLIAYKIQIEHQKDVERLSEYFYKDSTIYMERKKQKFDMTISSQATQGCVEGSTTNSIPLEQ